MNWHRSAEQGDACVYASTAEEDGRMTYLTEHPPAHTQSPNRLCFFVSSLLSTPVILAGFRIIR
jgi:hypothetical protein